MRVWTLRLLGILAALGLVGGLFALAFVKAGLW